jgi:iron complex transport system permease protein
MPTRPRRAAWTWPHAALGVLQRVAGHQRRGGAGRPIGFIGIVVPHLVRLLVGVDHRIVLPASALFGATFLVLCDLLARTLLAPVEIPVGVVTAIIGGPFFLWLLVREG